MEHYSLQQIGTQFMYKVYGWMAAGLGLTGITAYIISTTNTPLMLAQRPGILLVLMLIQLGLVVFLSGFIQRMSSLTAHAAFLAYAVITGVTFSTLFLVYTQTSLATTFIITATMFAVLALYGFVTKRDLTSIGSIAIMALVGLLIGLVINLFLKSSGLQFLLSGLGVILFSALTAYDVQRLKLFSYTALNYGEEEAKVSILGALSLYLNFVNLFLMLLSFTGRRRN